MRYLFKAIDFWEELATVTTKPVNVVDTGKEITFDFGDTELTTAEEKALIKLMAEKPMLRGKLAKLITWEI